MAVTWTIEDAKANAEGLVVSFQFRLTATGSEIQNGDEPLLWDTDQSLVASKFGILKCWTVAAGNQNTGSLAYSSLDPDPTPPIKPDYTPFISDFEAPKFDGANWYIRFRLGLELEKGRLVAMNNDAAPTPGYLDGGLLGGWVDVRVRRLGNPVSIGAAPTLTGMGFGGSKVGRLPPGNLRLHTDTQAQWVDLGGGVNPLTTWYDLAGSQNLTAGGATQPALAGGASGVPALAFSGGIDPGRYASGATPPVIQAPATLAAVFKPNTAAAVATIVGRYNGLTSQSWRLYYKGDASPKRAAYQFRASGGIATNLFDADDATILFVVRRAATSMEAWVNGRPAGTVTGLASPVAGSGPLYVGAKETGAFPTTWNEPFVGDINQVALYDAEVSELELSLIQHEMSRRALIDPGTPIPAGLQNQPYTGANNRRLDRRPIAVINLAGGGGNYNRNPFGQNTLWRPNNITQAAVENNLRNAIRMALTGCDQFEIMFNRPGGQPRGDIVPSHIFGSWDGQAVVLPEQWAAMHAVWNDCGWNGFGLTHYNDQSARLRRGWFYTGSGLAFKDDNSGQLQTDGHMYNRVVGPATAAVYKQELLDLWIDGSGVPPKGDDRYRCLFLDAAIQFYGKLVEVVHDSAVKANFTLVGEAIPQDAGARKGAPWFALASVPRGPWWNLDSDGRYNKGMGYNPTWSAGIWSDTPIYFGVLAGTLYLNLTNLTTGQNIDATNMHFGDIYRWVRKDGIPVAWGGQYNKIGAAWDYGTGRLVASRYFRSPRIFGWARV